MRVQKTFTKSSRTRSEFALECDINQVMARFEKTGIVEHLAKRPPTYGDVSGIPDFHQANNLVIEARETFASLPARVRKRFNNDPGELMEFIRDPANAEEARKLGLLQPLEDPAQPPERSSGDDPAGSPQGAVGEPETPAKPAKPSTSKKPSEGS